MASVKIGKVKLDLADERFFGFLLVAVSVLPSFVAIPIPAPANAWTAKYDAFMRSLGPNNVILVNWEPWMRGMPYQWEGPLTTAIKVLWDSGAKFFIFAHDITTVEYLPLFFEEATGEKLYPNPQYGTRYVYFGFIGTGGPPMRLFLENFRAIRATDNYGNKLDDLPLMKTRKSIVDFEAYLELGVAYLNTVFVPIPYKNPKTGTDHFPSYAVCVTGVMNNLFPMYMLGWWDGVVFDNVGGAELDQLHGLKNTESQKIVNGEVLALGLMMLAIIISNMFYYARRREK